MNYVSHVGPYAYEPAPPPPPTTTLHVTETSNDYGSPPSSAGAAMLPLNLAATSPTVTPVPESVVVQEASQGKKYTGKGKGHKGKERKG